MLTLSAEHDEELRLVKEEMPAEQDTVKEAPDARPSPNKLRYSPRTNASSVR